jgi:hypothetical protein
MSINHIETLREFDAFIAGAVEDFAGEEMDPSDYCFEVADGSQYAIYYSHAWDLVNAMRHRNIEALRGAEMDYADLFPDQCDTDTRMCRLAYILTHQALAGEIQPS